MRVDKASLQILSRGTNQNGLGYVQNRICQRLPPLGFSSNDKKAEVMPHGVCVQEQSNNLGIGGAARSR